jgi:hypothetical protein
MPALRPPMKMAVLKEWADWEDIHDDIVDLKGYWEQQPKSTEQLQNVHTLKETLRLLKEVIDS